MEFGALNTHIADKYRKAQEATTRSFPASNRENYEPMAYLNQYTSLKIKSSSNLEIKSPTAPSYMMAIELYWLRFKPGYVIEASSQQDENAMKELMLLGVEIDRDNEC